MRNYLLLLIFIVFFILLGFGFWYYLFYSQTKLQLSSSGDTKITIPGDWLTFEDQPHNIAFRYPQGWQVAVISNKPELLSVNLKKEDLEQPQIDLYGQKITPFYEINLTVNPNSLGLSAKDLYLNNFLPESRFQAEMEIKEVSFSGIPAIQFPEGVSPSSGVSTAVLFVRGGYACRFIYSAMATQQTHEKFLPDFEQILSTINFPVSERM